MQPKNIIDFKSSTNRYVKLFGKEMPLNYRGATSCTWHAEFGPISASIQFCDDSLSPWSAQIVVNNKATEHSSKFADILQVEKWVEDRLTSFRQTITALIPEPKGAVMSNITNVPRQHLPPTPKIFGSNMYVDGSQSKLLWSKKYHFAAAYVKYDLCLPVHLRWSAELQQMGSTITFDRVATVEEVQTWLERELVNVRNKVVTTIPATYEEPATEFFSKKSGWRQLPAEPFELPCFAVRNKNGQHSVILKAANHQGDVRWYTHKETHPNVVARMTWHKITQDFDEYLELPS